LPYFGELEPLLQLIAERLEVGGYFLFNTEVSENRPWFLQKTGRFAHSPSYIEQVGKLFTVLDRQSVFGRKHQNKSLTVNVFLLQKLLRK